MTSLEKEMSSKDYESLLCKVLTYLITKEDDITEDSEGQRLIGWVNEMQKQLTQGLNPFESKMYNTLERPVVKLENLLRECLLTQRWPEALKLMAAITRSHEVKSHVIFKVGLELCHQLDPTRKRLLEQIISQLRNLHHFHIKELTLEYLFFILCQSDLPSAFEEALDVFKTYKKAAFRNFGEDMAKRESHYSQLFEAYRGVLLYTHWRVTKQRIETLESTGPEISVVDEADYLYDKRSIDTLATRAMDSLKVVEGYQGLWDTCITKYIEVLEWTDQAAEAEMVLTSYVKKNPQNPNSHRYLMCYYKRHGHQDKMYSTMQSLAKLLPSDAVALGLYELHHTRGAACSLKLPLLFDLLDYPMWQDEPKPWQLLSNELCDIMKIDFDEATQQTLRSCWSIRLSWWPQYHFIPDKVKVMEKDPSKVTEDKLETLVYKAAVAIIFSTGAEFVEVVQNMIENDGTLTGILTQAKEASINVDVGPAET